MNTESHYMQLLELLFTVVQSLVDRDPSDDQRRFVHDAEGLVQKFFFHGLSALYLSRGTVLPDMSFEANFGDFASTAVLVRTMLETYLIFYYTYIDTMDNPPMREFRYLSRVLYSLLQRQRYPVESPEAVQQLDADRTVIEQVRSELQNNSVFLESEWLDSRRRREILERGMCNGSPPPFQPWVEVATRAGLGLLYARTMYSFLSIHAHSGYIGTLQVRQVQTSEEQRESIEGALGVAAVITAKMVFSYCELFPEASEALDEMLDAARLAEIYAEASLRL
jgi:hypothetical protein